MGDTDDPSEAVLVGRVQAGDEDAFRILFERHAGELERFVARWLPPRLRRKASVSDVMQEARLVAFRRLPEFEDRGEGSVRKWLTRIVRLKVHAVIERYANTSMRAAGREVTRADRDSTSNLAANQASPSQLAIASELAEHARAAIRTLPRDYREVLHLAMEHHLPLTEVASRLGRSREATKKLYGRAVARFTAELEKLRGERHA